jgi:hypothetical protein
MNPSWITDVAEQRRLNDAREAQIPWKQWGPYLSKRQWRTVREDYSENGDAWNYFTHDQARSRAYKWGEDGIGGACDDKQRLCFALALWNECDPILKERLYGLTNSEKTARKQLTLVQRKRKSRYLIYAPRGSCVVVHGIRTRPRRSNPGAP